MSERSPDACQSLVPLFGRLLLQGAAQQTLSHSPAGARYAQDTASRPFCDRTPLARDLVYSSVSSAQLGTLREAASGPSGTQPGAKLIHPNW